jgi:hypothetical protein
MSSFTEIIKKHTDQVGIISRLSKHASQIQQRLERMGFEDLTFLDKGTDALAVTPADNNEIVLVFRDRGLGREKLPIPQMLQSIYTESLGGCNLEILPKLNTRDITTQHRNAFLTEMETAYKDSDTMYGRYRVNGLFPEIGLLQYRNSQERMQTAPIAFDPGSIERHMKISLMDGAQPDYSPRCTANYPTLEDQRRVQQAIIDKDERLKQLTNGTARAYPNTTIIAPPGTSFGRKA